MITVERKSEGVKILKKYEINEWLCDFAIDNNMKDGDEILIILDGRELCIVSPKFEQEEVTFKVIKSRC